MPEPGALRGEVGHLGVTVGSAHPSWIDTDMVRGAEHDLRSFRDLRAKLPWPARSTTSVEKCAEMVVGGIERRARRIYVPRAAGLLNWVRPVLSGPIADRVVARQTGRLIPQMEAEVASLDRAFGSHVEAATVDTARD